MRHTNNTQPTPPSTQTKPQGVCNTTVYIEGMENELEHFPQLIDDNGFDTYPKFASWYAPGRITNMGSAIPKTKGVPRFTVLKDFVSCEEPDPNLVRAFSSYLVASLVCTDTYTHTQTLDTLYAHTHTYTCTQSTHFKNQQVHRKFRCTESTRKPNAAVKICVYSDLKEWSDADGYVRVSY